MEKKNQFEFLDVLVLLVKWKKQLALLLFTSLILSYLAIYFFVDEQFESEAVILPTSESEMGLIAGALGGLTNLPLDIPGMTGLSEFNLYNTIIYSRNVLERVIDKFNLIDVYEIDRNKPDYFELTLKRLRNSIDASETKDMAYKITVTAKSPELAADITNYLIELLNGTIVELKIKKSSDNRNFLAERVSEIRQNLLVIEDSLAIFQKETGMLEAEFQIKEIMSAYGKLESNLITVEAEKAILERIYGQESPQAYNLTIQVQEYQKRLDELKRYGLDNSILLSMKTLPDKAITYFRLIREIKINQAILEFVLPLFEQAKFDEQKDIPILQVLDSAVPPAKKSFPPRVFISLLITFGVFIATFTVILIKENTQIQNSEKAKFIRENFFKWRER